MTPDPESLEGCVAELGRAAARLRAGEARGDEAAELVERCAELATRIASALDEQARALGAELPLDEWPEQERLL